MSFDPQAVPTPAEFTTCSVTFASDPSGKHKYTYKVLRALDLKSFDQAVVTVKGKGLSLVNVVEVHADAQLDPEAKYEYQWILAKGGQDVMDKMQQEKVAAKKAAMADAMAEVVPTSEGDWN